MACHQYNAIIVLPPSGLWASAYTDDLWMSGCECQSTTESVMKKTWNNLTMMTDNWNHTNIWHILS